LGSITLEVRLALFQANCKKDHKDSPGRMFDFLFPDPEGMQPQMLFWIFLAYGYMLFTAANLLSDGSELLLFIPQVAGLVGSVVLPVLGAVPDGMMVLFSGLGPTEKAQQNVAVGVGALAGSTIMLLTVPWFLAVLGGRVDIEKGKCLYNNSPKVSKFGLVDTFIHAGIRYKPEIRANAKIMVFTAITYLIIQVPALYVDNQNPQIGLKGIRRENSQESTWAFLGMVLCFVEFCMYMYMQYAASLPDQQVPHSVSNAEMLKAKVAGCVGWIRAKMGSAGMAPAKTRGYATSIVRAQELGVKGWMEEFRKEWKLTEDSSEKNKALLDKASFPPDFRDTLQMWYKKYAESDDGRMGIRDFDNLLRILHLNGYDASELFAKVDTNSDGSIDLDEFTECFKHLASLPPKEPPARKTKRASQMQKDVDQAVALAAAAAAAAPAEPEAGDDDDEEEDEEESMPEEFKDLSVEQQRRQILLKSAWQMGLGTLMVLVFSDPMVDVLAEIGNQSGIPSFYISFILAPLASNSSELVAAYNYAGRKTSKTITIALNTLEGAACMNNTFCLGIFMALVYFQGLAWKFTAETLTIIVVEFALAGIVLMNHNQRVVDAFGIFLLFPGALAMVYILENYCGLD